MDHKHIWTLALFVSSAFSCWSAPPPKLSVSGRNVRIEFNEALHTRVVAKFGGKEIALTEFGPSEYVHSGGKDITDFSARETKNAGIQDSLGKGRRHTIAGVNGPLRKEVAATVYDQRPSMVVLRVRYTNTGAAPLEIDKWTNHHYRVPAGETREEAAFWSFQGGSYQSRPSWVLPLKVGFQQDNFQGMNSTDYGGGTPVVDVWRPDAGIGVGHLEMAPKLVSLPVTMPDASRAALAIAFASKKTLAPGESLDTFQTFLNVHTGDFYTSLAEYRKAMVAQGFRLPESPADAFEPIWCAWGYRRDFKPEQIYGALPIVKKLGFKWVTLDDGWQTAEGDWYLLKDKFPRGDADMRAMVDRIHAEGFKAQLWWAPMAVDPETDLITKRPEQLLANADGSRQRISYWNAFYLCPADARVRKEAADFVIKALRDWDYDGLKLDGQHLNAAPPCYNAAHGHKRPEDSVEGVPGFFKAIFDAALSVKPDAVVELCPCGTSYSFFSLPYTNMVVASDPRRSWQVRTKGKSLKAMMGDSLAYFGDHVELSDESQDFASTVGLGGVIGTEFTWPVGSGPKPRSERGRSNDLTPERETHWARWLEIYRKKMLPKGEYAGTLYDIGFDRPETHVVRKDGKVYYAFYAPEWNGKIELRGLANRRYRVVDYVNDRDLGTVRGPVASLEAKFSKHLLVEASPQ